MLTRNRLAVGDNMNNDKKNGFADLHVHTNYSDGVLSPEEVVAKALEMDLRAVAITDHDCIDGVPLAVEAAEGTSLEIVPGVEISAAKEETEIHILGYFIDWKNADFTKELRKIQEGRVRRMEEMLALLQREGIDISMDSVLDLPARVAVGRLHLARVLVKKKFARDIKEAFDKYIGYGKPCHVAYERLDYKKAIEMITAAGGVPVLAHPGTIAKDEYIPSYVEAGIRGLEVYYTKHLQPVSERYLALAEKYNLLATGGSDCHGMGAYGVIIGQVKVDYGTVEALREEAEKIRSGRK